MTLPASDYRDPLQVAIRRQEEAARKERACGNCRERVAIHWHGEQLISCGIKYQQYGRRCEHYRKDFKKGDE